MGLRTPLSVLRDITAYSPAAAVRLRLRLLWSYLTESAVAPLNKDMVEIAAPNPDPKP